VRSDALYAVTVTSHGKTKPSIRLMKNGARDRAKPARRHSESRLNTRSGISRMIHMIYRQNQGTYTTSSPLSMAT